MKRSRYRQWLYLYMDKNKLVAMYCYICEYYDSELYWHCQRFSRNNLEPEFTDVELLTIYLFVMTEEEKFKVKAIWRYASNHLRSWFPQLPSYQAFNARLNLLAEVFPLLAERFLQENNWTGINTEVLLVDAWPIMLCSGKRKAKVATQLSDKGYCATKNMHYYGVKLHVVAQHRKGSLPFPTLIGITPASCHDLTAIRGVLHKFIDKSIIGDKAYADMLLNGRLQTQQNSYIYTPVKLVKGQSQWERQFSKAANELFSTAVSRIRQPIESLFNWLNEKTQMQNAAKVRSTQGLLVHIFGRLSAACYLLAFNS